MRAAASSLACLAACAALLACPNAAADARRFALVLGNNAGHSRDERLGWAEEDARKMHRVLLELGGFAPEDARLLLGADADQVWKALLRIEKAISAHAKRGEGKTLFLFFYSGHAEDQELELGESSLGLDGLLDFLRSSSADVRLAFLDSCHSGKLVSMKGGRRGPGFDIRVTDEIDSSGYAIVTSSADDELSQESAEIRGAFFTHYLVSALRGAGDESGDGKVTLGEAYRYAYDRTLARTSVTIGGSQHPMYEFRLEGRGEIVLTQTDRIGSQLAVTVPERGRLVILDADGKTVVAETDVLPGETAVLALEAGTYRAYLLARDNSVRIAAARLEPGARADLSLGDFADARLEAAVSKGGLFDGPEAAWTHRLGAAGLWRLWALEDGISSWGASILYRAEHGSGWEPTARLTWTSRGDVGVSTGYNDLGAIAGLGHVFHVRRLALRVAALLGYEHMLQDPLEGRERHTSGFAYLGLAGLEVPISALLVSLDAGVGGRAFRIIDHGWVHRLDVQVILGLGWKWET